MIALQQFYPVNDMKICDITHTKHSVTITIKSATNRCTCSKCGTKTAEYHGTYKRKVQDLPIFGKTVYLLITAYEYKCSNPECDVVTFVEDFEGFLSLYSRMTERCADFLCSLALETSCEGASRICQMLNLKTSGDSIIALLKKRFRKQPTPACSNIIGVDDFAFKKRQTYGTIIVDEATHKTVAVLDGRDGKTLTEWLENNKHVKTVTRDRASAYAKAVSEMLPDAVQIADRFHLHQNLLQAIHKAVGREIPATIAISKESQAILSDEKKMGNDNFCKKNRPHCG
jgi:transposase